MDFRLSDAFLEPYKTTRPDWGPLGEFVYLRCVTEETPVLCADFRWRPAGSLKEGDELIAFSEERCTRKTRHLCRSVVSANRIEKASVMGIELKNGKVLYATPEHRWLVKKSPSSHDIEWVYTKDLIGSRDRTPKLMPIWSEVWKEDTSYEAGYLAAAFDGEGSLDRTNGLCFVQTENEMLMKVEEYLQKLGIKYSKHKKIPSISTVSFKSNKPVWKISIYGKRNLMEFIGRIRPQRFIRLMLDNIIKDKVTLFHTEFSEIVRVWDAGERNIAVLSTSSKTHITDGVPSHNTYSRKIEAENRNEAWWETVRRVVEGVFNIQKNHCKSLNLPWKNDKAQKSAQLMYQKMFEFKFLPSGRNLWMMGTNFVEEKGAAALLSCSFISTEDIKEQGANIFSSMMDLLMLGVGAGFDTKGAGKLIIKNPKSDGVYIIPDSREGWVESTRLVLDAYFNEKTLPTFDYSLIRPAGEIIHGFGGIASGPDPLIQLHKNLCKLLDARIGQPITSTDIVDIENFISVCVISGNVRRSAAVAIGDASDKEYVTMKDYKLHPAEVAERRWGSNNSVFAIVGKTNYSELVDSIALNGEPGIVWLENVQKYSRTIDPPDYKDYDAKGVNACSEMTLQSKEFCVSLDTRIQTKTGAPMIRDIIGKSVEVFNGEEWSTVVPFLTGKSEIYRVWLSDGSYLDTTSAHGWSVLPPKKRTFRRVNTADLEIGSQVVSYSLATTDGVDEPFAFEMGLFTGDGFIDGNKVMLAVHGDKLRWKELNIKGVWYKEQHYEGYAKPFTRVNISDAVPMELARELNSKNAGLPEYIFSLNKESLLQFIAGWIESDGSVCRQAHTDNYRVYGTKEKMNDLLLLLRRVGVDHATIRKMGDLNESTNYGKRNQELWYCQLPSYEGEGIPTVFKKAKRIGSRYKYNNAHAISSKIDSARKQKIVKIEKLEGEQDTACFTEPKRGMGVFGTVLTYQCNLVETFPSRHETYAEYEETLKMAYLYGKSVTLVSTHLPDWNATMLKNRRIGLSMSGIIDAFEKHGRRTLLSWCDYGYEYIQELDAIYSDWLCIPRSRKTTTVKPSGSVSLLPGVSPGIHYPHSEYYIRRVRVSKSNEMVTLMRVAGYRIEDDIVDKNTVVISFPVHEHYFNKSKSDVTIWEQCKNVVDLQRHWADNNVSVTVTFKESEKRDLSVVLEAYEDSLKTISFLPLKDHGYAQAPYETITKEQYDEMIGEISDPDFGLFTSAPLGSKFCDGEHCMVG